MRLLAAAPRHVCTHLQAHASWFSNAPCDKGAARIAGNEASRTETWRRSCPSPVHRNRTCHCSCPVGLSCWAGLCTSTFAVTVCWVLLCVREEIRTGEDIRKRGVDGSHPKFLMQAQLCTQLMLQVHSDVSPIHQAYTATKPISQLLYSQDSGCGSNCPSDRAGDPSILLLQLGGNACSGVRLPDDWCAAQRPPRPRQCPRVALAREAGCVFTTVSFSPCHLFRGEI